MPDSPMTQRDVVALNTSIRELSTTIKELRIEMATTYVRKDVLEPTLDRMQDTLDNHSSWLTWGGRLVLGVVFLALLAGVIVQGGGPS